ncbi:MAG: GDSL-type esterase/lipase family protein [Candidatus Brocadiia bacterium]
MNPAILIGDSIRIGYAPFVRDGLAEEIEVWAPEENGGDSRNVLAHVEEWVLNRDPVLVHLNSGLHDIKRLPEADGPVVPLEEYRGNVSRILKRALESTNAVIWALTTPVNEEWHHENKPFDRREADVAAYSRAAAEVCAGLGVPVNDLHTVIMKHGRDELLLPDGVHFTDEGYRLLGETVAREIVRHLR